MARKTEDPGLFAERDEHPALRYRETDPETSKEAASQFTKTAAAHREQIIDVLRAARGWEKPSDHVPVIATFDLD